VNKLVSKFLSKHKIGIFIISRFHSKRLNKKASLKILGKNLIEILILRLKVYIPSNKIIICTSKHNNNNLFYKKIAKKNNIKLFMGEEKNVLKRIIDCMKLYNLKHFVRITGDNPMTDIKAVLNLSKQHIKNKNDYTFTNSLPMGTKPEVFSLKALERNYDYIVHLDSTEYLTYYFLRKDLYKIQKVNFKKINKKQNLYSISINEKKDYLNLKKLFFNKKNLNVSRNNLIKFIMKFSKRKEKVNKINLKTKKYNATYKFDKPNKYIKI